MCASFFSPTQEWDLCVLYSYCSPEKNYPTYVDFPNSKHVKNLGG